MLCASAVASVQTPAGAQPVSPPLARLATILASFGGLSERERAVVERGDASVRVLQTPDRNEVALLGVVAVAVPRDYYTGLARAARPLLASRARVAWGTFGTPAAVADVAALTLGDDDAKALRTCRPQHCAVKLPADVMARFRSAVDWSLDPRPQADSLAQRWLVDYVDAYRERGDAAMPVYDDTHAGERSAAGFEALLERDAPLLRDAPALARYLAGAPTADVPGVTTTLHWSVDRHPGLAPIVSVAQLSAYVPPAAPEVTLVADKQLYASHYFDALLDVTVAVDAPAPEGGMYVALLRRARFDNAPGGGMFGLRGRIVGKLRDALRASLLRTKQSLERSYGARTGARAGARLLTVARTRSPRPPGRDAGGARRAHARRVPAAARSTVRRGHGAGARAAALRLARRLTAGAPASAARRAPRGPGPLDAGA